jgi:hypothetical protein
MLSFSNHRILTFLQELYERSTHLEAPGAGEKGRFAKWFRER